MSHTEKYEVHVQHPLNIFVYDDYDEALEKMREIEALNVGFYVDIKTIPAARGQSMSENEARPNPSEVYRNLVKENEEIMQEFMQEYENDILKDREKSYGNPIEMHNRIASIWSALLNKPVSAYEVALCMTGLKLARATKNASDPDSLIDAHGYTEIAQTIQADIDSIDVGDDQASVPQIANNPLRPNHFYTAKKEN